MFLNGRNTHYSQLVIAGLVFGLVLLVDQLAKAMALNWTLNSGISGSFLAHLPHMMVLVGVLLVVVILGWWGRQLWVQKPLAAGLLFGGATSNLVDRVLFGGVRDHLPIPFIGWQNNLADYAITVAIIWLIIPGLYQTMRQKYWNYARKN